MKDVELSIIPAMVARASGRRWNNFQTPAPAGLITGCYFWGKCRGVLKRLKLSFHNHQGQEGRMLQALLNALFGCSHQKTTFPLTVQRKTGDYTRRSTYVVCLRCGAEFAYDWPSMRIQERLHKRPPAPDLRASVGDVSGSAGQL